MNNLYLLKSFIWFFLFLLVSVLPSLLERIEILT